MDKKIIAILRKLFLLNWPYDIGVLTTFRRYFSYKITTCNKEIDREEKKGRTGKLTLKAPPIICSRRQFQILPIFQK